MNVETGSLLTGSGRALKVDPKLVEETLARLALRDYQDAAVRAYFANLDDRTSVKVIELPTGTGKTWVGAVIAGILMASGIHVLWVCHRAKLLKQSAKAFATLFPAFADRVRRDDLRGLNSSQSQTGQLVLTTMQTWYSRHGRLNEAFTPTGPMAVVSDEVHWGFNSRIGKAVRRTFLPRVPVLGLSATPPDHGPFEVIYRKAPEEFFGTVLATPDFEQVATGVDWAPTVSNGEFTTASVQILAADRRRNTVIVEKVVTLRGSGRASMLVFAANVKHAQKLADMISKRGVPARAIHSKQTAQEQDEAESSFRSGMINVLVNVDQLTEGFDHPPVDAVLLTCPTRSRRRWVQMVGRGARRTPDKDKFLVVDFCDNVIRFSGDVVNAGTAFPALFRDQPPRTYRPQERHAEPRHIPKFINYAIPKYGTLPISLGQTFGVELELTIVDDDSFSFEEWDAMAERLIEILKRHVTAPVHPEPVLAKEGPLTAWRVTDDTSCGLEVVSPILEGVGGFDELERACAAVAEMVADSGGDLKVDYKTGLHITLATRLNTHKRLRTFMMLVQRLEPGLFTLVAPSRLYAFDPRTRSYSSRKGNRYCLPFRRLGDPDQLDIERFIARYDNRYRVVNLTKPKGKIKLLEVRMHSGTFEFSRIALWLSLWMQIFNHARYRWAGSCRAGQVFPGRNRQIAVSAAKDEDIVHLLRVEGMPLTPEFEQLLRARRKELRPRWKRVIPKRVRSWEAAGWYVAV